jgi:opacity protein-like surface antigen
MRAGLTIKQYRDQQFRLHHRTMTSGGFTLTFSGSIGRLGTWPGADSSGAAASTSVTTGAASALAPTAAGVRATIAGISSPRGVQQLVTVAATGPAAWSAASLAIDGNPISSFLVWEGKAIGPISATRVIDPFFSTRVKTDGIGLLTAQVGWAWNASLLYFKGGAAVTSTQLDIIRTVDGLNLAGASATRWGGAVGVGWEYGFASNWSVGVEYDHLFMGNAINSFSVANPIIAGAANRISQDIDMVTLRFNYRFGGYGSGYGGPGAY